MMVSLYSYIADLPMWVLTSFLYMSLIFLCFKWWQVHPKYGNNIGPPVLPIVGSFFALLKNSDHMYEWATALLRQSPSHTIRNVLFGLELYTTANPANVEYMLKTNFNNYIKGSGFQSIMEDMLGNGIFNVDGELWKIQRKAASHEFTSTSLKTLMLDSVHREISDRMLPVLYGCMCRASHAFTLKECSSHVSLDQSLCNSVCTAPVDLQDIFMRFAFDNICQLSLGVDPAHLNHSLEVDNFAQAFDDATELLIGRFFTPGWIWRSKRFLNVGSERRLKEALHVVKGFAMDVIQKRKQEHLHEKVDGSLPHHDLLFRLLQMSIPPQGEQPEISEPSSNVSKEQTAYEEVPADMKSDELVRDTIICFLIAGRDSSSIGLTWFFWLLMQHPHVEAAIYEEITRVVAGRKSRYARAHDGHARDIDGDNVMHHDNEDGDKATDKQHGDGEDSHTISDEGDRQLPYEAFTYEELKEMKYLQAALQETMRLYPPVPHDTKLVVKADVLPDGTRLNAGAQLAYHPWAMGRMESIWGEDWASFRPERWMEQRSVSAFKWPVFQAGPRICLGKDMAMLQMKCVAAALIERFSMALPANFQRPRYQVSFTLKMQQGLPVHLHPRRRRPPFDFLN